MKTATQTLAGGAVEQETKFVEPEVYFRLITSRRTLVRLDDPAHGVVGLFDPESQVRFVVEERRLWSRRHRPAASVAG
jgi:hypothetical protein